MALVKRNHNPFAPVTEFLYMIIDRTTLEGINVVKVASMRRAQLLGRLLAAEGKVVIAPPVENRGLSKLSDQEVRYLYWNLTKESPAGVEYADLLPVIIAKVNEMTPADDHIPSLEYLVDQLDAGVTQPQDAGEPKPVTRPKGTTTTGIIWTICDEVLAELFQGVMPADTKPLRAEAFKRCDAEGFHSGTFGVQYSKWAKVKKDAAPAA